MDVFCKRVECTHSNAFAVPFVPHFVFWFFCAVSKTLITSSLTYQSLLSPTEYEFERTICHIFSAYNIKWHPPKHTQNWINNYTAWERRRHAKMNNRLFLLRVWKEFGGKNETHLSIIISGIPNERFFSTRRYRRKFAAKVFVRALSVPLSLPFWLLLPGCRPYSIVSCESKKNLNLWFGGKVFVPSHQTLRSNHLIWMRKANMMLSNGIHFVDEFSHLPKALITINSVLLRHRNVSSELCLCDDSDDSMRACVQWWRRYFKTKLITLNNQISINFIDAYTHGKKKSKCSCMRQN